MPIVLEYLKFEKLYLACENTTIPYITVHLKTRFEYELLNISNLHRNIE